jgi:Sulfotransferase family
MTLPNFLVIGAAKAGTTSLYHYLRQHPGIYLPAQKEINFFALEGKALDFRGPGDREVISSFSVTQYEDYLKLFVDATNQTAIGEVSPMYLYDRQAPARICRYIPDARLICILRNPVERAFSHYLMFVRDKREPYRSSFSRAIAAESERMRENWEWAWSYVGIGFYAEQLTRYYELFDSRQIRIYLHEEFGERPYEVMRDIFQFLQVDATFRPDISEKFNVSLVPRSERLEKFLQSPSRFESVVRQLVPIPARWRHYVANWMREKNVHRPSLSRAMRKKLVAIYRNDILKLQDLIGRDLGAWLKT